MSGKYLESVCQQFRFYKQLADKTMDQLDDEQLFWQYHEDSNSIAILVQHIAGNTLSRFTDFLTSDGEKEWRDRDSEFIEKHTTRTELLEAWETGWQCLFDAIDPLVDADLDRIVYIRNQGHTVVEAINRSMAHHAYHVGQIVHTGIQLKGKEWQTLSVPKGGSKDFNKTMFEQPKREENFMKGVVGKD